MTDKTIRVGIFGALEKDLGILSELHRQEQVHISFIFERKEGAVGLEIAEILGIPRSMRADQLPAPEEVDCVVVSEPRARFADELQDFIDGGTRILTPSEALKALCRLDEPRSSTPAHGAEPQTIEETLQALERLFDRQALLKFLLEVAVRATESTAGSVMLYSEEAKELYIAHALGLSERVVRNTRQKLGDGISGWVAQTREAQLLEQPSDRALYARGRDRMDIASAISVPLIWDDRLLGVLNVSSGKGGRLHDQADLTRLKTLSRRLSRVLFESLKLQEVQLRHQSSKFRDTVGEIANKDISMSEKLSVLSRYLSELIGAETVEIFLATAEGDWFVLGGSNRILTPTGERIRYQRGALNRAFIEQRCIVMTEGGEERDETLTPTLSLVYCPLPIQDSGGVVGIEFSERYKLDEFLLVQDDLVSEVGRFIGSELRERQLKRKVDAFGRISDAAASLLGCHTVEDLVNVLTRVVGNVLECERVSARVKGTPDGDDMVTSHLQRPGVSNDAWLAEDEDRFDRLNRRRQPFSIAFLDFESAVRSGPSDCHSLLAYPVIGEGVFYGGIIAYSKDPSDPIEETVFTDLDRDILQHLIRIILPVLDTIYSMIPVRPESETAETYETVLSQNLERFRSVCTSEISRSDRYHHGFTMVLFRVEPLAKIFKTDPKSAYRLIDDITQGIRTRTRKTDYGCWIDRTSYAMLSLEGSKRIRFLISRVMTYLAKDLSEIEGAKDNVRVGTAVYPGTSRSAEDLIDEARSNLEPYTSV